MVSGDSGRGESPTPYKKGGNCMGGGNIPGNIMSKTKMSGSQKHIYVRL